MRLEKNIFVGLLVFIIGCVFNISIFAQASGNTGEYFICGISTREDLGGVDVFLDYGFAHTKDSYALVFENHNNYSVSVIFEYDALGIGGTKLTGVIVLKAGEKRTTPNRYSGANNFKLIVRKLKV